MLRGHGNNGGDSYACARRDCNHRSRVRGCTPSTRGSTVYLRDMAAGGDVALTPDAPWPDGIDLIIDDLLGTGLSSAPRAPYDALIARANAHAAPVLALDIPFGLNAQTGACAGDAIVAVAPLPFIVLKPGLLTGRVRACVGALHYADLGLSG
ncbi:MAG: NAD(P)H-hydrate epimerase [Symbiopectobacterium sp.]|uniref:NAD(P)H-hydrate epimerase n=1 Tax=Symbiopectobacterium sp. TaxID=2952789 RepID=UPI003F3CB117